MIDHIQLISVGDMIEAINGQSLLGCRHYEVARLLKELPRGRTFTLKLTEPRKAFGEGLLPTPLPAATHHPTPAPACSTKGHQQVVPKAQLGGNREKGGGAAPPFLRGDRERVLAFCPAQEEDGGKEEVAPTPSFQEPLA